MNISQQQNVAVDIVSAHHYAPSENFPRHYFQGPLLNSQNCYFDKDPTSPGCVNNASLISVVAQMAADNGQVAYVGEFGGPNPNFTGQSKQTNPLVTDNLLENADGVPPGCGGGQSTPSVFSRGGSLLPSSVC